MHQKEFISNGYIMVVLVVEFSSGGYKIGKIIAQNRCVLRIRGAPVCQKLGMILENSGPKIGVRNYFFTKHGLLN